LTLTPGAGLSLQAMDSVQPPRAHSGIGPVGRGARAVVGVGLLLLALAAPPGGLFWNLALHELLLARRFHGRLLVGVC